MKNPLRRLYIFNLSTDLDNEILAFTHDWIEEFSRNFDNVFVYSTHLGTMKFPKNVFAQELGGGNLIKRMTAIFKILSAFLHIILKRNDSFVFYHMNTRAAAIIGLPLKILQIPQILWYSHAHASFSLKFATNFADRVVSTSISSFPFKTKKLISTGHGVRDENVIQSKEIRSPDSIVFIGRISGVKRLEVLIEEVSILQNLDKKEFKIYAIGPCEGVIDQKYKSELVDLAINKHVQLFFIGSIPHRNAQLELAKYEIAFNGTLQSLDKGAIESVFAQCILVSDQSNTLIECGYSDFSLNSSGEALKISEQLSLILSLSESQRTTLVEKAKVEAFSRHSLSSTIDKICMEFSSIKVSNEK